MSERDYFRPLGLVFGPDARSMVADGKAGWLGGSAHIAFTRVEVITRDKAAIARRIKPYKKLAEHSAIAKITQARPAFAGLDLSLPKVMGIVNVTPDSFSDGGRHGDTDKAVAHGLTLAAEGADILDVGGESTRPGSEPVAAADEMARVLPVIEKLAQAHAVSVDTRKAAVMAAAISAGAQIINDVSALGFDPESAGMVARLGKPVVLMHAQGEPKTMQLQPKYDDVVLDVYDMLSERIAVAVAAGIPEGMICVDPGIGFGKSFEHNLALMQSLAIFHGLGVGVLAGVSRKNMIGVLTGEKIAANRVSGSVGSALHAALNGAHILRVHDVCATVHGLKVFTAMIDPDLAGL